MKQIYFIFLVCIVTVFTVQSSSVHGGNSSTTKSISEYFKNDKLITNRQAFYNADKTQRVEYYCEDENMPGGENEGASNPANVHCTAALFLNKPENGMFSFLKQSDKWVFSDKIELRYGSIKKFAGHKLIIEKLEYSDEDALCCPSERSTQVFNTSSGKLVEDVNSKGKTLIVQAVKDGSDEKRIGELISQGSDINAKDKYGQTALMIAAENSNLQTIKLLLNHHADVNAIRNNGKTALIIASDKDSIESVKLLLDKGANPNIVSNKGKSALYYAIQRGNGVISQLLIDRGSDVNSKTQDGKTALMVATDYGREDLVQLLIEKSADINAMYQGTSVLQGAAKGSKCKIVRILLDKGASANIRERNEVLMRAAAHSHDTDCLQALIEKGTDINAKNDVGQTPLIYAATYGPLKNVEWLMKKGADPSAIAYGQTALEAARQMGKKDVVDFLENLKKSP